MSLTAAALLSAGTLVVAPGAAPTARADNCPDVAVTFARGTDEPSGLGRVGQALVDGIRQNTGKNVDAYPVNYRATLFQIHGNDGAKAIDYCNPEDPICHAGQGNEWKGHTDGYVPVYTSQAASFVQTRLLSVLPPTVPSGPLSPLQVPGQGPLPGEGPLPGPSPLGPVPSVVDQTQPVEFR